MYIFFVYIHVYFYIYKRKIYIYKRIFFGAVGTKFGVYLFGAKGTRGSMRGLAPS